MSPTLMPALARARRVACRGPSPKPSGGGEAADPRADDAGQRLDAELRGAGVAHDDHRGRAVVEGTAVAGRDDSVGPEDRLELGDRLVGDPGAGTVVAAHDRAVGLGD